MHKITGLMWKKNTQPPCFGLSCRIIIGEQFETDKNQDLFFKFGLGQVLQLYLLDTFIADDKSSVSESNHVN